jgi:large subunit ribosomal protein L15
MTVKRRKKITKQRGSRTCGWGLVHRGSGQKGGAGNAGTGKKANAKAPRPGLWTKQLMGKHGFIHHGKAEPDVTINLRDLEDKLPLLLREKLAAESAGAVTIDIGKAGYTKVLGSGRVTRKWRIIAQGASPDAVEKIKAAGGELTVAKSAAKAAGAPKAKPAKLGAQATSPLAKPARAD